MNDGDASLMTASQRGDKDAFARHYDRYQNLGVWYRYDRVGDWDDVGDSTQEIFVLQTFRGLPPLAPEATPAT